MPYSMFHLWERADMPGVRSCIEDFYGKGYPYPKYLDGTFLERATKEGSMLVLCGKQDGRVISVSAVDFHAYFEKSGLLMLRVVRREYRGLGIGDRQQERLMELIRERKGLLSLYADVMTHDCISQKSLVKEGFVLCGLRLLLYDNRVMVPQLQLSMNSKMSQAVMCKRTGGRRTVRLCCPKAHVGIVKSLYRKLGVTCLFRNGRAEKKGRRGRTDWLIQKEPAHACTTILLRRAGTDFQEALEELMSNRTAWHTWLCYLDMEDCGAPEAYELLREKQFFFSGIKPLNANGEYMMLSNTGAHRINTEEIKVHPCGAYLVDYILTKRTEGRVHETETKENQK